DRASGSAQSHQEHDELMAQDPSEAVGITGKQPVECAFRNSVKPARPAIFSFRFKKAGAKHGGQSKRNDTGNEDRHAERHRERVETGANQPAHEQEWNENGNQGGAHGDDGEANLASAFDCSQHGWVTSLDEPEDVLDHDDGIIDNKANGDGDGHEGEVIDAVIEEVHDGGSAGESERNGDAGDERGPKTAQEQEDN